MYESKSKSKQKLTASKLMHKNKLVIEYSPFFQQNALLEFFHFFFMFFYIFIYILLK
jgi:hypothetical protein